eukprot:gene1722-1881_t
MKEEGEYLDLAFFLLRNADHHLDDDERFIRALFGLSFARTSLVEDLRTTWNASKTYNNENKRIIGEIKSGQLGVTEFIITTVHQFDRVRSAKNLALDTKMEKSSRECFLRLFTQLPHIISNAFKVDIVQRGWELCGLIPLNVQVMLSKCLRWKDVTFNESVAIVQGINPLIDKAGQSGICCLEEDIRNLLVNSMDGELHVGSLTIMPFAD